MEDKAFDELLESVKEMDNIIMDANELRYKFKKLADSYSHFYMYNEILNYLNTTQLQEFYEHFNQLHPGIYDEDGNHI